MHQITIDEWLADLWCGKTSPEPSLPTTEKISEPFWKKPQGLSMKTPLFLNLQRGDGQRVEASWEEAIPNLIQSPGEPMTHSSGEFLKDENGYVFWLTLRGGAAPRLLFESELWRATDEGEPYEVITDIGEERRPEVQSIPESVPGYSEPRGTERKDVAADFENGVGATGKCLNSWDVQSKHIQTEDGIAEALYSGECRYGGGESYVMQAYGISSFDSNSMKSPNPNSGIYEAETTRTLDLNGGSPACNQGGTAVCFRGDAITNPINASNPKPGDPCHTLTDDSRNYVVQGIDAYNQSMTGDVSKPLNNSATDSDHVPCVMEPLLLESNQNHATIQDDGVCTTLPASMGMGGGYVPMVTEPKVFDPSRRHAYEEFKGICGTMQACMGEGGGNVPIVVSDVAATRSAQDGRGGVHSQMLGNPKENFVLEPYHSSKNSHHKRFSNEASVETLIASDYKDPPTVYQGWVVRRLTPTECMRLQGYPDDWCDLGDWRDEKGKLHKDSDTPKYKAAGNSIALPFWAWLAKRICAEYDRPIKMASLFDGIGGFPLVFQRAGAEPVWCSEIEPFPDAVTKRRFG